MPGLGAYRLVFVTFLGLLVLASCKNSRCAKSTGTEVTEIRELQAFTKLKLDDRINVQLKPSTVNRATITCGKNLMKYIVTDEEANTLTIRNNNTCNFLRSYKKHINIVLEYTDLSYINFIGAGKVSSTDTLAQPYLMIESEGGSGDVDLTVKMDSIRFILHTGNVNVNLNGRASDAYFYSGGTTILDARNMKTTSCFCNNSGSGDFYVNAISYLFADIEQQGSIFYHGNPSIDKAGSGTGQLKGL